MKICVLVLTYKSDLYDHFDRIKRKYLETKDVDYYFLYNGADESLNDPKEHNLNYYSDACYIASEGWPVLWEKFMKFVSDNVGKYDYIIRENSSTFVNVDRVIEEIKLHRDREDLYMGYINTFDHTGSFASGGAIVFSDITLQKLLEINNRTVDHPRIEDDVLIGMILREQLSIFPTFLDRFMFQCFEKNEEVVIPPEEVIEEALTYPQIRIRNDNDRHIIDKGIWNIIERKLQL